MIDAGYSKTEWRPAMGTCSVWLFDIDSALLGSLVSLGEGEHMHTRIAISDVEVLACYAVMRELRPHLAENQFLARVRSQEKSGYRLAYAQASEDCVAVAGFRISENLAWGRFLYVDDLVTLSTHRSQGHGHRLLAWLRSHAAKEACPQLHLDSGMHRTDAHRFYEREGMVRAGYHFSENVATDNT